MLRLPRPPRHGPVSERVLGKAYEEGERGGSWLAAGLFAIALFLFLASLSVYEVTQPDRARHLLETGIASLTDIDQLIEESLPLLREEASSSSEPIFEMPGYPIPVTLSRVEALTADAPTIRTLLLERSARLVFTSGLDAFESTGEESTDLFSAYMVIRELIGFLTGETHDRSRWLLIGSLIAATVLGATTIALNRGFSRFTSFGLAVLLAAAPGYILARGGSYLLDRFGSSDAFLMDLQTMVQAMLDVPERNFLIVGALGLIVAVAGWLLALVNHFLFREEPLPPMAYDASPVLPLTTVPGPTPPPPPHGGGVTEPLIGAASALRLRLSRPAEPPPPARD